MNIRAKQKRRPIRICEIRTCYFNGQSFPIIYQREWVNL